MEHPHEKPLSYAMDGPIQPLPPERIFHERIEPFAFDGLELRVRMTEEGAEVGIQYLMGPDFKEAIGRRLRKQDRFVVNGGILFFQERLSWAQLDRLAADRTIWLRDLLHLKAFNPARAAHSLLMVRFTGLTIRVPEDDITALEFDLRFEEGLTFTQRVARTEWSDIFDPTAKAIPAAKKPTAS